MSIPSILRDKSDIASWPERRAEILSLFENELFGKTPELVFDEERCVELEHLRLEGGVERRLFGLCFRKGEQYCGLRFSVTYKDPSLPVILHLNPFTLSPRIYANRTFSFDKGGIFPTVRIAEEGFVAVDCHVDEFRSDSPIVGSRNKLVGFLKQKKWFFLYNFSHHNKIPKEKNHFHGPVYQNSTVFATFKGHN